MTIIPRRPDSKNIRQNLISDSLSSTFSIITLDVTRLLFKDRWYTHQAHPTNNACIEGTIRCTYGRRTVKGGRVIPNDQIISSVSMAREKRIFKCVLDAGAEGVLVPQVYDTRQVSRILDACRYPPKDAAELHLAEHKSMAQIFLTLSPHLTMKY